MAHYNTWIHRSSYQWLYELYSEVSRRTLKSADERLNKDFYGSNFSNPNTEYGSFFLADGPTPTASEQVKNVTYSPQFC